MRAPVWPPGVIGSITHHDCLAAAVALPSADANGICMDAERVTDALDALLTTAFTTIERAYLCSHPSANLPLLATIAFSAKESFFKATSNLVGRYSDFDAVEVESLDMQGQRLGIVVREDLAPPFLTEARFEIALDLIGLGHLSLCIFKKFT